MTDENRHHDIDEMLNAYMDDELTERQQTEVQRLITHDSVIAERFVQLQRQTDLVKTLPSEKAPADILYKTSQSLEKRALLGTDAQSVAERAGEKELYMRKMISAAAMLALIAAFFVVVYTILSPTKPPAKPVAQDFPTPTIKEIAPKEIATPIPIPVAVVSFSVHTVCGRSLPPIPTSFSPVAETDASAIPRIMNLPMIACSIGAVWEQNRAPATGGRPAITWLGAD